ncbi:hypothetical protein [Hwanghaeella sp.]|uniref:hypothetical protein n=1 Tax=Hwanghaeella sp. TaxID=2605943 RepID=UPI003CCBFAC7
MGLDCISCGEEIDAQDINIEKDIAKCAACGEVFAASVGVHGGGAADPFDPHDCPEGVSFDKNSQGFVLTATTRSGSALFLIPFTLVWSGFSIGNLYIVPLLSGKGLGVTGLFGIPFVIGTVILVSACLMRVMGRVEIRADGYDGTVFTGVGPFGWTKRFSWRDVWRINEGDSSFRVNRQARRQLSLDGKRRIAFGTMLSEERMYHVRKTLEGLLKNMSK